MYQDKEDGDDGAGLGARTCHAFSDLLALFTALIRPLVDRSASRWNAGKGSGRDRESKV